MGLPRFTAPPTSTSPRARRPAGRLERGRFGRWREGHGAIRSGLRGKGCKRGRWLLQRRQWALRRGNLHNAIGLFRRLLARLGQAHGLRYRALRQGWRRRWPALKPLQLVKDAAFALSRLAGAARRRLGGRDALEGHLRALIIA